MHFGGVAFPWVQMLFFAKSTDNLCKYLSVIKKSYLQSVQVAQQY
jgi:hypothetical protein